MANAKSTKRALLFSVLSLVVCVTMLIGSTFAWFTDSATTGVNTIVAGNLDLKLEVTTDNGTTWKEVNNETKLFNDAALWEPGYTEVAYLKLSNVGNLAFKYELAVNVANEVVGKTADGKAIKLSEVLKFGTVEGTTFAAIENRDAAVAKATGALETFTKKANMLAGDELYLAIAVTMPTTVGNEANHDGVNVPSIQLGVNVIATQYTYESDSFGNDYDKNAPDLEDKDGNIIINDAVALLSFANKVNNGETYKGKTVLLNADIDLAGYTWTPIGNANNYPSVTFAGTFNGQGHTISNMYAVDRTANYAAAGLFGSITGVVKNVNIDKATVISSHYAGGVVGYSSSNVGMAIENCKVTNSTITSNVEILEDGKYDNGDKVGGIIGYMVAGDKVTGCTVENTTISAYRDLGGIVGHAAGTVTGNGVKDVTLVIDKVPAHNYKGYKQEAEHDLGQVVGENAGATVENNTVLNVTETEKYVITSAEELKSILTMAGAADAGNANIELTADVKLAEAWTPVNVDGYNGADVITLNGNGHTISGLTAPLFAGGFAGGSGIVINDLTIADSNIVSEDIQGSGAFIENVDSMDVITLKNCHVKNSSITGSRTGGLIGWNSGYNNTNDGAVKTYVTVENCSVVDCEITGNGTVGGIVGHAGANAWTYNTITNCKVENCTLTSNDDTYRVGAIVGTANVGEVVIIGCTSTDNTIKQNNNGTEITRPAGQSDLYGRFVPGTTGKLTINGTEIK